MYIENDSLILDELEFEKFIEEIEKSLLIKFETNDFVDVKTVGQLFESILNKLSYGVSSNCGTQKAFYILRQEIDCTFGQLITPKTKLKEIIRSDVRHNWRKISDKTQLNLPTLQQNNWQSIVSMFAVLIAIVFFIVIFFAFKLGGIGFGIACLTLWTMGKLAKELPAEDVKTLTERVLEMNYAKITGNTYNQDEIVKLLKNKIIREAEIIEQPFSLEMKLLVG